MCDLTGRILHISDLHLRRADEHALLAALRARIGDLAPAALVVTGDLTHRGHRADLGRARDLLESLGVPYLAVPGNHDLPYSFPRRFTRTHEEWVRAFGTTSPSIAVDGCVVVGLNSTRPWRQQGGALAASELARLEPAFEDVEPDTLRVVALHHHIATPPWRVPGKRPVSGRDAVVDRLAAAGVELVLSGHVHQSSIAERREFEFGGDDRRRSLILATVAGFGRPRPRRHEAVGFSVYEFDAESITVVTQCWTADGAFVEVGRRRFRRGGDR